MTTYLQSRFSLVASVQRVLRLALAAVCLGFALSGVALSAEQASTDEFELNFTDTDITAVITAVAKLTGKNFIIDPRVKGKVTVITHKAMTKDEVYEVFQSMLKVHGFAAVPGKSSTKIVPEVNAKQDTIKTLSRKDLQDGDEMVTKVIQIKHVTAAQLVPILRPLVPQRGHLAAYPQSNVLIISDSAGNIARLSTIIGRIDQAVNQEIEVLTLEHAVASDVVRVINQLHQGAKDKRSFTIVADDRTNSVLLGGDRGQRLRLRAIITHMDVPLELTGNTQVVYLRYANAADLVKVLTDVSKTIVKGPGGKTAAATTISSDINIQADENTNALIINAPPGVMRTLRSVINQLDIRREQVHLEAVLAEVSYTKSSELGVQWALDGSDGGDKSGPIGILNFSSFAPPGLAGLLEDPPLIGEGLNLGIGKIKNGDLTMGVLIRALAGDGNTNILATPSIVTLDNEEASIVVGQNVPFLTGQYASTGGGTTPANPFQTIDRQDVGITLKITPQINEGNTIKMSILQEISSLTAATIGVDIITNKREITTNVMVEDDQILVLGGLIDDQLRESEAKIPGLGDIPLLGWLFKYKTVDKVKQNLMVFIHPTIMKDQAQQSRITGEKYNFMRQKQIEDRERGLTLFKDVELPVMREFSAVTPLPPRYIPMSGNTTGQDAPPPIN